VDKVKYLLLTGQIAKGALARAIEKIDHIELEIKSLECTVAALMSTAFIARKLACEDWSDKDIVIVIPGLCQGSLQPIMETTGCKVLRGPKDLIDLPAFFQSGEKGEQALNDNPRSSGKVLSVGHSPIQILAEIVNAVRMSEKEILERAFYYRDSGADIIDLGGDVDQPFPRLPQIIKMLKNEGFKVSVDSHQKEDILAANQAGVDLILSFTSQNLEIARGLDCQVVVIPDNGENLASLYLSMEKLDSWNISYLVDPILPPLTMGLAAGIGRYLTVRKEFPDCELLMGLGNVTELVDADSTGINALMVGIAGELKINYILTTEVSHRAQGAVREVNLARHLIHQALMEERVPKHLDYSLLTIKDPSGNSFRKNDLWEMHGAIRDKNYRIFVYDQIYVFNAHCFWQGTSAQEIFSLLEVKDSDHSFYLGQELGKAEIALQLGKKYVQDSPLRWGYLNDKMKNGK
jgi:dihydropteroate synthase